MADEAPEEFDQETCRQGTYATQIETPIQKFKKTDLISLVIADFNFEAPSAIHEALAKRLDNKVFGYSIYPQKLYDAVSSYYDRHHKIRFDKSEIFFTPGVVPGVSLALRAVLEKGDGVCMMHPEYPPFYEIVQKSGFTRNVAHMQRKADGSYCVNWEDLEAELSKSKALLLSNPHNPTGTVFSAEDLRKILSLCNEYGLYVLVDEIWCDLVFNPAMHTPALALQQKNVFAFYAASKSFNIAGLHMAVTITEDSELQRLFNDQLLAMHLTTSNCFGIHGFIAALMDCDDWLERFRTKLRRNMEVCVEYFEEKMPFVRAYMPESTSLLWLDFSALFDTCEEAEEFCVDHGVCLEKGCDFCKENAGGMLRMQCGCCMKTMEIALDKIKVGYDERVKVKGLTEK